MHAVISANENVPCDVKFTSAATNDSFTLASSMYSNGEIVAMDRDYINYEKFEELTERDVAYVTKLKKNLVYEVLEDCMDMDPSRKMQYREQVVVFRKGGDKPYGKDCHLCRHEEGQATQAHTAAYK